MTSRRGFLASTTAAFGTTKLFAAPIDPIPRIGKPVLKTSLAAYSMRQFLDAKPGAERKMDLFGFLEYCAGLGLQGAELTSYYFPKEFDGKFLNEIKRRAQILGLDLSGGAIRNDFCQKPGPKLEADEAHCDKWAGIYSQLGVRAIRIFAGNTPKGDNDGDASRRCVEAIERRCVAAEKAGVFLALENHGGITSKADVMLEIVKTVKSPWFGVNFDSGNFRETADPYAELAKIAPYAVNAQIKIEVSRKIDGKGKTEETDYRKVIQILKDAKYSGWIALEYEGKEDPYAGIPKALDKLRNALAAEGF